MLQLVPIHVFKKQHAQLQLQLGINQLALVFAINRTFMSHHISLGITAHAHMSVTNQQLQMETLFGLILNATTIAQVNQRLNVLLISLTGI